MKPGLIQRTTVAALTGLSALVMPVQTGCTSFQPTRDEHNRIVGYHREFDSEKTLSLIGAIAIVAANAYGIPAAARGNDAQKMMQIVQFSRTLATVAEKNKDKPVARVQFEGEPFGYRELGDRVNEAIEKPHIFAHYLGLDTSGEMPVEVKRLEQIAGKWESKGKIMLNTGQTIKTKGTSRRRLIENGWFLFCGGPLDEQQPKLGPNQIYIAAHSITGWSPKDGMYHNLQIMRRYADGLEKPIVSFGETTSKYDPVSGVWTGRTEAITGDNFYVKGTLRSIFQGDTESFESETNFGKGRGTARKISN